MLSERLGIPIVTADELEVRAGRLYAIHEGRAPREIQVVYRRTDEDRFRDERGDPTWIADLLLEPLRAGNIAVVNAPGAGIGDDKLTQAYVGEMIRFYLDQEPILPAVRTFDLGEPEQLEMVLGPPRRDGGQAALGARRLGGRDLPQLLDGGPREDRAAASGPTPTTTSRRRRSRCRPIRRSSKASCSPATSTCVRSRSPARSRRAP